ncbi:hypothetical protein EV421DRAFT_1786793 [Armillaria borealis]|uniref:Heterokaryon incompatibility domain-containing protein n=1 Tax=Armillaria borealis TaxID=47425 RepID=A0AA39JRH8_9AGAR|nr:hypothetical protein EV421DRAFT_1786793 [Armillaria borealis]
MSIGHQKKRDHQDNKKLSVHQEDAFSSEESLHSHRLQFAFGSFRSWSPNPPEVTLSALAETGQQESSIPVLKQQSYTGTKPAISSALANTPCAEFGVSGILEKFDVALSASYNFFDILNTYGDHDLEQFSQVVRDSESMSRPSSRLPHSILEPYIERNDDFGTAHAHLCRRYGSEITDFKEYLHDREEHDQHMRQTLFCKTFRTVPPRRVWDLRANRVDRTDVWTPINGYQWPVPIPKDSNLDLIRIEMLNLGADYVWLDVLCLRQPGGPGEHLRMEEWKVDVPTIGWAYRHAAKVAYYFNGLGRPLSFKPGDFESDRCWFNRAWTLQEITPIMIIGGETASDGMMEGVVQRRFKEQLQALQKMQRNNSVLGILSHMRDRVSTNPVDRIAGLAYLLDSTHLPTYDMEQSEESAWVAFMNAMGPWSRVELLFFYPAPGNGSKYWHPSWNQAMANKLPFRGKVRRVGNVGRMEETDTDWHEGPYIDSGYVQGLANVSKEGGDRQGELIIKDHTGEPHTFKILASHEYPIPDGSYVLLGAVTRCDLELDFEYVSMIHWVAGHRQDDKFKKWSVFSMADAEEGRKLRDLRIAKPRVRTFLC